ncbi:MAG: NAD(P)-dependent oxidoreductase [Spirochaetes bacterium]|nr:NAD(P)-dependent oxidoreductase [Spirochaetota bacterium]
MEKSTRIGWIGTGVMGRSMCGHVLAAGFPVSVFTRTRSKAKELLDGGAVWKKSPYEVAKGSDIVFSIVSLPSDVEDVYLSEHGVLAGLSEGGTVVDMTTSSPKLAVKIYDEAKKKSCFALDAPVSGGDVGAKNASLAIMTGGDRKVFDRVLPLFETMGKAITYMGKAGSGQHTKMVNQIHIATTMIGTIECLLYAYRSGLDPSEAIRAIGSGAAGSWSINNYGPRIVNGDFEPGFFIDHFIKDMGIALEEAKRMSLSLPGLSLAHEFYIAAKAQGLGKRGTQALYLVFERMNGIER